MKLGLGEDELALQARARDIAQGVVRPRASEIDQTEQYPWDVVKALREATFMGMTIPKAYGGQGRSFLETVLVIEEMAKACTVTARIVVDFEHGRHLRRNGVRHRTAKATCGRFGAWWRQTRHLYHRARCWERCDSDDYSR